MDLSNLPALNAILNSISGLFLVSGYVMIRRRRISAHRACMLGAFTTSTLFFTTSTLLLNLPCQRRLGCISQVKARSGWSISQSSSRTSSWQRWILPLALITLVHALRERFDRHARIARWTLPVWLYVSVTGVVVYVMLYRL